MKSGIRHIWIVLALIGSANLIAQDGFLEVGEEWGLIPGFQSRGVSFCDYDNDGDQDLYFSNVNQPNQLYQNMGDGTFEEVGEFAGVQGDDVYSISGVWADYDNDGWVDLYVGNLNDPNVLYKNNGDGTFTDVTSEMAVGDDGTVRSVMWADVNADGFVDLYVANLNMQNRFYINQGGESFVDLIYYTQTTDTQVAQGAMFFDYDNDGDQDLYLTHDEYQEFILYQNDGSGVFDDVSEESNTDYSGMGMGVDYGDYNRDGNLDIYFTLLGENALLSNNGDGTFTDISDISQTIDVGMGWGTFFFDYDNDGWQDLFVANDSNYSPVTNKMYHNNGDSTFTIVSEGTPIASLEGGWGAASGDLNGDGKLEVVVANSGLDTFNELFLNLEATGNWIGVELEGVWSNFCAIGARVEIYDDHGMQIDEVNGGSSFASQNSMQLHFGLGELTEVDSIRVRWPSGLLETWDLPEINTYHHLVEGTSTSEPQLVELDEVKDETEYGVTGVSFLGNPILKLYPNPAIDRLVIKGVKFPQPFKVYSTTGAVVSSGVLQNPFIQVGGLDAGTYILCVEGHSLPFVVVK